MFGVKQKPHDETETDITKEQNVQRENHLKWYYFLASAIFVLVGIVFIIYKEMDITFICRFAAVVLAVAGIISVISYIARDVTASYYRLDLVYGMMAMFAALLFITKQEAIGNYFPVIIGCILFANGVIKMQHSIDMKRLDRKMGKVAEMWLVILIFALACITAGCVSVFMSPEKNRTFFVFAGIALVVAGITDIFANIAFARKVKMFRCGEGNASDEETSSDENVPAPEEGQVTENAADQPS